MPKIDCNERRDKWAREMYPNPVWGEGSDAQQDFADELVEEFCQRFAKYLCWAERDGIADDDSIRSLTDHIFYAINDIDDARWWCNKKNTSDYTIAIKLLADYEDEVSIVKKMHKEYGD